MPEKYDTYVEYQNWPAENGLLKATLVITAEALMSILYNESACVAPEDVPNLVAAIGAYANGQTGTDVVALSEWHDDCEVEDEKDDDEAD